MRWHHSCILASLSLTSLLCTARAEDLLLIPQSLGDNIWAFSPVDGHLINNNFIASDGFLSQPIEIVVSPAGTLIISDEVANAIFEYSIAGVHLRTIVGPAQGVSRAYGLEMVGEWIYFSTSVTVGGVTTGKLNRVRYDGTGLEIWCQAQDIISPRDIAYIGNGQFLVGDSGTAASGGEDIELLSENCFLQTPPWHNSDGISGIHFPQHIHLPGDGTALVAGFSSPFGLFRYELANGLEIWRSSGLITSPRGVFQLDNGKILYTGGTRVMVYDPAFGTEVTIVNQLTPAASFRWPTRVMIHTVCPGDLNNDRHVDGVDLAVLLSAWGTAGGDLNGDGTSDGLDLAIMLSAWGTVCP